MTETGTAGPLTGWQLGGWTLENLLGAGGMGSVYRATRDGAEAAIKVLSAQLAGDEELQKRFQREIKIAAGLRSGRVARLLDAETDGPVPWFATELIEGPTLEDVVVERGPLEGEELRAFAEGLARAVDDLAQAGVVHRDIKPANVILTDWSPILLDFGVATTPQSTTLTATGIALGTPVWMSPEQLVGRQVDRASDVFSWATTTAYAATGRHPFGPGGLEEIAHRIVRGGPNLDHIDPALRRILRRALVKDPKARPSATDLVHAATRVTMTDEAPVAERTARMDPLPIDPAAPAGGKAVVRQAITPPVRQGPRRAEARPAPHPGGRQKAVQRPSRHPAQRAQAQGPRPGGAPRPRREGAPPRPASQTEAGGRRRAARAETWYSPLTQPTALKVAGGVASLALVLVLALALL